MLKGYDQTNLLFLTDFVLRIWFDFFNTLFFNTFLHLLNYFSSALFAQCMLEIVWMCRGTVN